MTPRPKSLAEAQQVVGRHVLKEFLDEQQQVRPFNGEVVEVLDSWDEDGITHHVQGNDYLYNVRYEDGDLETLEWEDLHPILKQQPADLEQQRQQPGRSRSRRGHKRPAADDEAEPSPDDEGRADMQEGTDQDIVQEPPAQPSKRSKVGSGSARPGPMPLGERDANIRPQGDEGPSGASGQRQAAKPPRTLQATPATQAHGHARPVPMAVDVEAEHGDGNQCRTRGLPGHLKRIVLQDFMCHHHFAMDFGPHVTVVSGSNGSGKSAVMQGLQACMGVSARETGRSKSLSSFIREGVDAAVVTITLWNEGPDSYKPEIFGPEIVIERRIRRPTGGDFKLYGAHRGKRGGAISTKREDVDAVLDHFNINAANPLTVITQDMARTFLHCSADGKRRKYDVYMEGTMLAEISDNISASNDSLAQAKANLVVCEDVDKQLLAEVARCQQELERLHSIQASGQVSNKLMQVAIWQWYFSQVKRGDDLSAVLAQHQQHVAALQAGLPDLEAKVKEAQERVQAKSVELARAQEEAAGYGAVLLRLKQEATARAKERNQAAKAHQHISGQLMELQSQRQDWQAQLQTAGTSSDRTAQVEEAQRKLAQFEQQVHACKAQIDALEQQFHSKRVACTAAQDELEDVKRKKQRLQCDIGAAQQDVTKYQGQLNDHQNAARSRFAQWGGQKVMQLLDLLQRNRHRFQQLPVGPVGAYLGLTQPRWSVAVERAVGPGLLERFMVSSMRDCDQLKALARQVGIHNLNASVVRFGLPRHNVQRRYDEQRYTSVLDVLRFAHDDPAANNMIFNMLVDSARIESLLLMEDEAECRDVMYHGDRRLGLTPVHTDGRVFRNFNGTCKIDPAPWNKMSRIGLDRQDAMQQLRQLITERQATLQELGEQAATLELQAQELRQAKSAADRDSTAMMVKKKHLMTQLAQLQVQQDQLEPAAQAEQQGEAEAMIEHCTQMLGGCQRDITATQVDLDEAARALQDAQQAEEAARNELNQRRQQPQTDIAALNVDMEALAGQEAAAKGQVTRQLQQIQRTEQEMGTVQTALDEALQAAEEMLAAAEEECTQEVMQEAEPMVRQYLIDKFHNDPKARRGARRGTQAEADLDAYLQQAMDYAALMREGERLIKVVQEAERQAGGSVQELQVELDKLQAEYDKHHVRVVDIKRRVHELVTSFNVRVNAFNKLKGAILDASQSAFNKYMCRRLHLGLLNVDYEKQEMMVHVKVKGKEDPTAKWVTDLKQLSGGERSYTQVALLLALGQWSEAPFRCLDEYDVYMDAINRRIATETLLEFALEAKDRQYVLLTPQDISAVQDARNVVQQKRSAKYHEGPLPQAFLHMVCMPQARPNQRHM